MADWMMSDIEKVLIRKTHTWCIVVALSIVGYDGC